MGNVSYIMLFKHIYRVCVRAAWIMFRDRLYSTEMKHDVCLLHWSFTEVVMPCCICSPPAICIYTPYSQSSSCHGVVEFWDSSEFPLNSVCSSCAWQPSFSVRDYSLELICELTFSLVIWIIETLLNDITSVTWSCISPHSCNWYVNADSWLLVSSYVFISWREK